MSKNNFWKAYGLTLLQILLVLVLSFLALILIAKNMEYVYPFISSLQEMQQTGILTDDLVDNMPLFESFILNLIILMLIYILLAAGVLSVFDILIRDQLTNKENKEFSWREWLLEWLFEWFRYSALYMLLLIALYASFLLINHMIWLGLLLLVLSFAFCYIVLLMNLDLSLRKTFIRAALLFMLYLLFLVAVIILIWLLKVLGLIISILIFVFLLLWSKVYLMRK